MGCNYDNTVYHWPLADLSEIRCTGMEGSDTLVLGILAGKMCRERAGRPLFGCDAIHFDGSQHHGYAGCT